MTKPKKHRQTKKEEPEFGLLTKEGREAIKRISPDHSADIFDQLHEERRRQLVEAAIANSIKSARALLENVPHEHRLQFARELLDDEG